jgi:CheY-like chemotaxis protein
VRKILSGENNTYLILIIDDIVETREVIEEQLMQMSFPCEFLHAPNGQAALSLIRMKSSDIDLIITDIEMPFMNGKEFIGQFRDTYGEEIPIIVLSGQPSGKICKDAKLNKNLVFLQKPWDDNCFRSIVSQVFEKRKK